MAGAVEERAISLSALKEIDFKILEWAVSKDCFRDISHRLLVNSSTEFIIICHYGDSLKVF